MKSILISIKPEWVVKIFNGEKTIEIRKTVPKCELPIDVYIYCTKGKGNLVYHRCKQSGEYLVKKETLGFDFSGKIIAKFRLEKIKAFVCSTYIPEEGLLLSYKVNLWQESDYFNSGIADAKKWGWEEPRLKEILKASCLTEKKLALYISKESAAFVGFSAWYISDLEIFDEPKKLSDFGLKRAPQSWCYVEELKNDRNG